MREIVLDTETTGLDPQSGDRIVEIGCVEMANHVPTGRTFHKYINPQRDMPEKAFRVHGLSADFLKKHPVFADVVEEFLEFIQSDTLVIHNADFDLRFLNAELEKCGRPLIPVGRAVDTVIIARQKFPGSPANLDALCRRFSIDNSNRDKHGALLDAQLLSEVYLELIGGRQPELMSSVAAHASGPVMAAEISAKATPGLKWPARSHAASREECAAHEAMLALIKNPLWIA